MVIKENVHPTGEQSIILQAIATTSFLSELHNSNFLNSDYFKSMNFENSSYKDILKQSGMGNPAVMHFALYAYLVMPKEILAREEYETGRHLYQNLNQYISTIVEGETYSTYPNEDSVNKIKIKYCEHIRNAVAHAKSVFEIENNISYVTFIDERHRNGCKCEIKLKTQLVGEIIGRLSDILTVYFIEKLN